MTKYATQRKYQPYIDIIMDDLGLTDKVLLEWNFGFWRKKGGSARLFNVNDPQGRRFGTVDVSKDQDHNYTLQILMHELKHIQQYLQNRLSSTYIKTVIGKHGKRYYTSMVKWEGQEMQIYGVSKNARLDNLYKTSPWEVEAYAYMEEVKRLFPNDMLPPKKQLVGKVNGVTFYKVKG